MLTTFFLQLVVLAIISFAALAPTTGAFIYQRK
jgi:hypothetical protein